MILEFRKLMDADIIEGEYQLKEGENGIQIDKE